MKKITEVKIANGIIMTVSIIGIIIMSEMAILLAYGIYNALWGIK